MLTPEMEGIEPPSDIQEKLETLLKYSDAGLRALVAYFMHF
jgi:hypothetical protein